MACADKLTIYLYYRVLSTGTLTRLRNNAQFHGIFPMWAVEIPVLASVISRKCNRHIALTVCKHHILQISAGSVLAVTILRNLVAGKWVFPSSTQLLDSSTSTTHVHVEV